MKLGDLIEVLHWTTEEIHLYDRYSRFMLDYDDSNDRRCHKHEDLAIVSLD